MIVRPPTLRPVKQAVALGNRQVVNARDPAFECIDFVVSLLHALVGRIGLPVRSLRGILRGLGGLTGLMLWRFDRIMGRA